MSTDDATPKEPAVLFGRRIAIVPFGCKVSQIEAHAAASALGPDATALIPEADVVVVYGCAVTDRAERDQRRFLRRLRRERPRAMLVVSGCLARRDPEALARLPEVDLVAPPARLPELRRLLDERDAGIRRDPVGPYPDTGPPEVFAATFPDGGRTRAFLKVQDGCVRRCAFCIVPTIRGAERSARPEMVEREIRRLGAAGVPEVVLAGVHLANFGKDLGSSLLALLRRLEEDPPRCRVRLSSLEPMEAGEALVSFVARSRVVVPHLHLPLQSGSDAVLRRMRRGITASRFVRLASRAALANPRLHLATDLIAGFPGETETEFEETVHLVQELPFASLHVFPFSPRAGTHGAALFAERPVLPSTATTRRAAALRVLGEAKARTFRERSSGTTADAIILRGGIALTDHYLEATLERPLPPGSRRTVWLTARGTDAVLAASPVDEAGNISAP